MFALLAQPIGHGKICREWTKFQFVHITLKSSRYRPQQTMHIQSTSPPYMRQMARSRPRLHLSLAKNEDEIREAQRLRYTVFGEELGAHLCEQIPGHDTDLFDSHCDHLLVRDYDTDQVIGTYRLISPEAARSAGSYYAEGEFSLTRLQHLRPRMIEIGRFCIHADYRSGGVMALLWSGLGQYIACRDYEYLIGSASISMADGGHNAANLYQQLSEEQKTPAEYRAAPLHPLPFKQLTNGKPAVIPPLLKGYLRAGGRVCGEPAWDTDFNTADLLFLLPMARLNKRYGRTFLYPYRSSTRLHQSHRML